MDRFDAVIVGSGINSLAAGALLARAGWTVCILERNDWLGGLRPDISDPEMWAAELVRRAEQDVAAELPHVDRSWAA